LGVELEAIRAELALACPEIMADTCDIIGRTFTDGGALGDTVGPTTLAENVPISYKSRGGNSQVVVGGKAYTASHDLTLPWTAITVAITPEHKIKVKPQGLQGELIFQEPIISPSSNDVFITVHATSVRQGFRQ
jgi:hypothetical protein